jgi:hypothetical protein
MILFSKFSCPKRGPRQPSKAERPGTWLLATVALVPPRFSFSNPISARLIREIAFENGYREPRTREITWSRPKVLSLIAYHRLREHL